LTLHTLITTFLRSAIFIFIFIFSPHDTFLHNTSNNHHPGGPNPPLPHLYSHFSPPRHHHDRRCLLRDLFHHHHIRHEQPRPHPTPARSQPHDPLQNHSHARPPSRHVLRNGAQTHLGQARGRPRNRHTHAGRVKGLRRRNVQGCAHEAV
ncbi:hypothetical protein EX30DRAFT_399391, partial [Ascodesmis nigricans]